jgi:GNAT superfamily N-acetyltransferase
VTTSVRLATAEDREFVVGLVPRLRAFGLPALRPADALDRAERDALEQALAIPMPDARLFIAEHDSERVGLAYAVTQSDYFTGERHGHLAILAVAEASEGRGVGRALLDAVESWSAAQGHRFVTLNVFATNDRARAVYERGGYAPDTIRYVKELPSSPTDGPRAES